MFHMAELRASLYIRSLVYFVRVSYILTNWFIVGCTHPVVIALMVAMASNPPAAPRL